MGRKIKVVWICHLSNDEIRANLSLAPWASKNAWNDFSQWNTNGINEFKKFEEIFEADNKHGGSFTERKQKDYRKDIL